MTQATLAQRTEASPAYINLIERNQRPLSATMLLRLADALGLDPRVLATPGVAGDPGVLRRRLRDPRFADLAIDEADIAEWLAASPATAEAFARLYDQVGIVGDGVSATQPALADPAAEARAVIGAWRNHFADLDAHAEALADELRLVAPDPLGAIADRLRARHRVAVRILPDAVLPNALRRLDLHARELQLSERLKPASRLMEAASLLAEREAGALIDALAGGARVTSEDARQRVRRHLVRYHAAATVMPYGRFLRACEGTGYDLFLLQRRFGVGFEQLAHRLTTLQRVGARGLPFFMLRIDRAGRTSKWLRGASEAPLAGPGPHCPLWRATACFAAPGELVRDLVELEDGTRWISWARAMLGAGTTPTGTAPRFAVILGLSADHAHALTPSDAADGGEGHAPGDGQGRALVSPIGLGCHACLRPACAQRGALPVGRPAAWPDQLRPMSPLPFADE